jgi:hypothetical protein
VGTEPIVDEPCRDAERERRRAAPIAEHLDRLWAGMESSSDEAGRQIPCAVRRRQPGEVCLAWALDWR